MIVLPHTWSQRVVYRVIYRSKQQQSHALGPWRIISEGHAEACATNAALEAAESQSHRYTSKGNGILTLSGSRAAGDVLEGQSPKRRDYYITD